MALRAVAHGSSDRSETDQQRQSRPVQQRDVAISSREITPSLFLIHDLGAHTRAPVGTVVGAACSYTRAPAPRTTRFIRRSIWSATSTLIENFLLRRRRGQRLAAVLHTVRRATVKPRQRYRKSVSHDDLSGQPVSSRGVRTVGPSTSCATTTCGPTLSGAPIATNNSSYTECLGNVVDRPRSPARVACELRLHRHAVQQSSSSIQYPARSRVVRSTTSTRSSGSSRAADTRATSSRSRVRRTDLWRSACDWRPSPSARMSSANGSIDSSARRISSPSITARRCRSGRPGIAQHHDVSAAVRRAAGRHQCHALRQQSVPVQHSRSGGAPAAQSTSSSVIAVCPPTLSARSTSIRRADRCCRQQQSATVGLIGARNTIVLSRSST